MNAVLETERLILREWAESDIDDFVALTSDPRVMRYINGGTPLTREETAQQIERLMSLQRSHGWTRWALELRFPAEGEPHGAIGFCGPGCTFAPDVEVGWWMHAALWGRGLATEAARAAVDHCFSAIGFPELICCVHPDNAASLAVAEKAGFARVGMFDFNGMTLVRHEQGNPLPARPVDPRFRQSCEGAATGPSVVSGAQPDGEPA